MIARHTAPIYPGEDVLQPPDWDDPRLAPWLEYLVSLGVCDANRIILVDNATLRRGVGPEGYIWEMEWPDRSPE